MENFIVNIVRTANLKTETSINGMCLHAAKMNMKNIFKLQLIYKNDTYVCKMQ